VSKPSFTLTAVDVDVKIAGITAGSQGAGVVVSELSVTFRVNDFSEASISLGYQTPAGLSALLALFPREGSEGAYFSEVQIFLKDGGPLSYLRAGGLPFFKGFIVGFSHKKQAGNISFIINAFGGPYQLGQIPMGAPGMHPGAAESWGVRAWTSTGTGEGGSGPEQTAMGLLGDLDGETSAFGAFKKLVGAVLSSWEASFSAPGALSEIAFEAARKAYALGPESAVQVQADLDKIEDLSTSDNQLFQGEVKDSAILDLTRKAFGSAQISIWHFLVGTLDAYGLDIICLGDKCFVFPKSPLADPVKANIIQAEDMGYLDLRDYPFQSPTRCIVIARALLGTDREGSPEAEAGIYPDAEELSGQEAKTGVKTIIVHAPAFMSNILAARRKPVVDKGQSAKAQGGKKERAEVKAAAESLRKKLGEGNEKTKQTFDDYARYILMKRKFRQRTGMAVMKFNPYLIPGLPGRLIDPITANGKPMATVDGVFMEITHNLSYTTPMAQTTVSVSHLRYQGELTDAKLKQNAIYPSFSPENASLIVKDNAFGI